jgi:hypothetical protein
MTNVKGVKKTQKKIQLVLKLNMNASQKSKWNHQSILNLLNQFKNKYKTILNELKLLSQANN